MSVIEGDYLRDISIERGAVIWGISCDEQGRLYVLVKRGGKHYLRLYPDPLNTTYTKQQIIIIYNVTGYPYGIIVRGNELYMIGSNYAWIKHWSLSSSDDIIDKSTIKTITLSGEHSITVYIGCCVIHDKLVFVGYDMSKNVIMVKEGKVVDTLYLKTIIHEERLTKIIQDAGPYLTILQYGHLLISVNYRIINSRIFHVRFDSNGFIRPVRIILQTHNSQVYDIHASGDKLIIRHSYYDLIFYYIKAISYH